MSKNKCLLQALTLIYASTYVSANTPTECNALTDLVWLAGTWVSKTDNRIYREHWRVISDTTYEGFSQVDSLPSAKQSFESLRIVEMSGNIFYLAKVPENSLPVAFKLVSCSDGHLQFENLQHDFPQYIRYTREKNNALTVSVEDENSKGFKIHFIKESDEEIQKENK